MTERARLARRLREEEARQGHLGAYLGHAYGKAMRALKRDRWRKPAGAKRAA